MQAGPSYICGTCVDGATKQVYCNGQCGLQAQLCQSGQWANQGGCVDQCGNGCCNANGFCTSGTLSVDCGSGGGACTNCNQWANGGDTGYGTCSNQQCCLTQGAPVYSGTPASSCCSGHTSCTIFGICSCA